MKFNCSFCKQYWAHMNEPYFNELRHKSCEATKDIVMFCPACRVPKRKKERWSKETNTED